VKDNIKVEVKDEDGSNDLNLLTETDMKRCFEGSNKLSEFVNDEVIS
jgi:hypothetical protein